MKRVKGGITAPKGYLANALNCGIKRRRLDCALLFSEADAVACGAFTQNKIKAAPVIVSQRHIKSALSRAIIVNSGNANCCNGPGGIKAAGAMAKGAAISLRVPARQVLIASTGVIGKPFPLKLVTGAIKDLADGLSRRKGGLFSRAIMTTDSFPKELAVKTKIDGKVVIVGGVAKGAGMIYPNMATMLSFITTDAVIGKPALKKAFHEALEGSFNSISVDGSMSTNDCVFMLANGAAGNSPLKAGSAGYRRFCGALGYVMEELARQIVLDGEGATKLITISVKNAADYEDAKKIAFKIANDLLFKTSVYGEDPNWGRIAAALGSSGVGLAQDRLDISLGGIRVLKNGSGAALNRKILSGIYKKKNIDITVDLKQGRSKARVLTCDLSKRYVAINASYT